MSQQHQSNDPSAHDGPRHTATANYRGTALQPTAERDLAKLQRELTGQHEVSLVIARAATEAELEWEKFPLALDPRITVADVVVLSQSAARHLKFAADALLSAAEADRRASTAIHTALQALDALAGEYDRGLPEPEVIERATDLGLRCQLVVSPPRFAFRGASMTARYVVLAEEDGAPSGAIYFELLAHGPGLQPGIYVGRIEAPITSAGG